MSNQKEDSYILSRGFSANTRLTCQHYLFKDGLGYLLHPSISLSGKENVKVAEIGVGTCIWIMELARTLPESAQIDGLDISFQQCPPSQWLPSNCSLKTYNALTEPPPELIERYDVIHVQLFLTIVQDGDPVPVLKNLLKMLKPGGYLQWGELDFTTWEVMRTPSASHQKNDELQKLREVRTTLSPKLSCLNDSNIRWASDLYKTFKQNGLEGIGVDRRSFDKGISTLLLDTWALSNLEIVDKVIDPDGVGRGDLVRHLVEQVGVNRSSTGFNIDRVITVGRKPLHK